MMREWWESSSEGERAEMRKGEKKEAKITTSLIQKRFRRIRRKAPPASGASASGVSASGITANIVGRPKKDRQLAGRTFFSRSSALRESPAIAISPVSSDLPVYVGLPLPAGIRSPAG